MPPVAIASELEAAGSSTAIVPSMVTLSEGATAELLLPVNDAGGGLATGAASVAAFLSLRASAVASRALLAAASCDSDC